MLNNRTRKFRRSMAAKHKLKARRRAAWQGLIPDNDNPNDPTDRRVGMMAVTPCPCSCWLCTGRTGREQKRMRSYIRELCTRTLAEYELERARQRWDWRSIQ